MKMYLSIIITMLFIACQNDINKSLTTKSQPDRIKNPAQNELYFKYRYLYSGLGSNFGSMKPVIDIEGTKLVYTLQQNSYYEKPTFSPDTIFITSVRQSSIDSIMDIVKNLKDTSIDLLNPCILSGGIFGMMIIVNEDTTRFEMTNTFHITALKISKIVDQYLPEKIKVDMTEKFIINEEDCWKMIKNKKF